MQTRREKSHGVPDDRIFIKLVRHTVAIRCRPNRADDVRREDAIVIPELDHAAIVDSREGAGRRGGHVGCNHRFPNDEHANGKLGTRLQDPLNCGGPPQANRSGRREENDHARLVGVGVERVTERRKRLGIQRRE